MTSRFQPAGYIAGVILIACGSGAAPAVAQDASGDKPAANTPASAEAGGAETGGLQEIVVTAQRRSENLQRAAIAVTALSPELLTRESVTTAADLTSVVPALQASNQAGYTAFYIRGIGSVAYNAYTEPADAFNLDGVYVSRPNGVNGQFFDIQRVEVLKGPQGTLYGRNATGGAINLITRPAELGEFNGYAGVQIGNYDERLLTGVLNVPFGDRTAARLAVQTEDHHGYFQDGTDDAKSRSARLSILSQLTTDLSVKVMSDYSHVGGRGGGAALLPLGTTPVRGGLGDPAVTSIYVNAPANSFIFPGAITPLPEDQARMDLQTAGVMSEITLDTALGKLTVIPAWRKLTTDNLYTQEGFWVVDQIKENQKSFEVRLASDDDLPLRYVLGGYYFDEHAQFFLEPDSQFVGVVQSRGHTSTHTAAAFSQLTYKLTPTFRATGGLRYTWERKNLDGTTGTSPPAVFTSGPGLDPLVVVPAIPSITMDANRTFNSLTWKGGFEWDVGPQSLLYVNVGTGFKAGGFFFASTNNSYDPEKVLSYAIGSKNRFFDNKLQLNAEAFLMKYNDQQLAHLGYVEGNAGPVAGFPTLNVGRSTISGFEAEAQYLPIDTLLLGLQLNYVNSRYDRFVYTTPDLSPLLGLHAGAVPPASGCAFSLAAASYTVDCSGRQMYQSPKWTVAANIQKTFELGNGGSIVPEIRSRYESTRWMSDSFLPVTQVGGDTRTDATLTYNAPRSVWNVAIYVNNLANKNVVGNVFANDVYPIFSPVPATLRPPRTFGVRGQVNF
jgi:iron complex outermembrane receptor protein